MSLNLSQEELIGFADELKKLEEEKKSATKDIKDAIDRFCAEKEISSKKQLKAAIKAYWTWEKDRAKFIDEIRTFDEFIDVLTGAKVVEKITEAEARK
jgi:uncharacterized protein (UPF0335 family)